MKTLTEVK